MTKNTFLSIGVYAQAIHCLQWILNQLFLDKKTILENEQHDSNGCLTIEKIEEYIQTYSSTIEELSRQEKESVLDFLVGLSL